MMAIIFAIALFLLLFSLYLIFIKSKEELKTPPVLARRSQVSVVRPSSPTYDKITPLQEKIDELNIRLNKKDFEIKDKTTQIANLSQQLNKKDFVIKQQSAEISDLNQRLNTTSLELKNIDRFESDINNYKKEIENYKSRLLEKDKDLGKIEEDLQRNRNILSKVKSKNASFYPRSLEIIKRLRDELKQKKKEISELEIIYEENKDLRKKLSKSFTDKEQLDQKKDAVILELNTKLEALNSEYSNKIIKDKNEIENLNREIKIKDKKIEELKSGYKPEEIIGDEKLKSEYEKLQTRYIDIKNKSDWVVKLIKEETEKNMKLQAELNTLKIKLKDTEEAKATVEAVPKVDKDKDEEKEYFLKVYQKNLKDVYVNEENIPDDLDELRSKYITLMRQAQMASNLLRDEMNKKYELQDQIDRLKRNGKQT